MDLCQMMLVCKQWNSILESTKALWRNVELISDEEEKEEQVDAGATRRQELLRIASVRSDYSLETFAHRSYLANKEVLPIMSLLKLSKLTLKKVDVAINTMGGSYEPSEGIGNPLRFFKDFEKLERLNLNSFDYPQVEPIFKGKLTFLALEEEETSTISLQELQWLDHLKVLHYSTFFSGLGLSDTLLNILHVSSQSLVELNIDSWGENPNQMASGNRIVLPNLKVLQLSGRKLVGIYDSLQAPKLEALQASSSDLIKLPFKRIATLKVGLDSFDDLYPSEDDLDVMASRMLEPHNSSLRELELRPWGHRKVITLLDPIVRYLKINSSEEIKCFNLTHLIIAENQAVSPAKKTPIEGFHDKRLLAEMLLSRRLLASKGSSTSNEDPEHYSSGLMLVIEEQYMEAFRIEEGKVLAGLSEVERELVGKAEVKSLEQWRREGCLRK